ncbi:lysine transporter LysE [Flavobacterium noncentrifugens]|uniref:Threonine/homoserine/homoserine lactone efflux protein n=1 Tax=Flavobacterium noncentrifugens TaxID=1128970 RepID=A0A1G8SXZ1_9FLAO|nr:LysE family translocator [Flavobacterium noncentrifugens]GEP50010.1 lysine transporter LysE [Flavobacterium noncentrifugens]SDJ34091.1 Threonine/homoserine/homoserine lactone efflux protein [Flavobacterium noncentrifugens]
MIEDILTGIPLGFFLSFMIGPVFFVLLETSVVKGFRAAVVFDLGVVLADIIFILIAYFSSYRLIQSIKDDPALFIFGGLVMLTYGIISFVKNKKSKKSIDPEDPVELAQTNYFSLFIKGFFLNFINIGVLGFWLAILITIGPKLELNPTRMFVFFTTVILSYFITDIFKILLAKQLRNKLNPTNINFIKRIISVILIVSGIFLLSQGWFPKERQIMDKAFDKLEHKK